jgi:hypothetical protein
MEMCSPFDTGLIHQALDRGTGMIAVDGCLPFEKAQQTIVERAFDVSDFTTEEDFAPKTPCDREGCARRGRWGEDADLRAMP